MSDLKSLLEERRTMVDTKATTYREARDGHNEKARGARTARDELSGEVRELITEVKQQREVREQLNEIVRSKKEVRKEATDRVRAARAKIEESRAPKHRRRKPSVAVDAVSDPSRSKACAETLTASSASLSKAATPARTRRRSWSA